MRVPPALPLAVWIPILAATLVRVATSEASLAATSAYVLGGLAAWTLVEYALHRWVFHHEPRNAWMQAPHRAHHEAQTRDRTMVHPLGSLPLGLLFLLLFRALAGADGGFALWAGLIGGYLVYEAIHYRTHFAKPRTRIGRALRRRHLQHHFGREDRWFGVTSPLWDYVFRTHAPRGG